MGSRNLSDEAAHERRDDRAHRSWKTTLTAAITKYCDMLGQGSYRSFDSIDNAPEEKARGSRST